MLRTAETFRAELEALTRQTITDHHVEQILAGIWPDNPDATDRIRASAARRTASTRRSSAPASVPLSHRCASGCAPPTGRASWSERKVIPRPRASASTRSSAARSSVPAGKSAYPQVTATRSHSPIPSRYASDRSTRPSAASFTSGCG